MAFSPGQFITAQRLNRLQPKTYWSQASGAVTGGAGTAADIAGTPISITVETNGATAAMDWSVAVYATGAMGTGACVVRAFWDVNGAPTFALYDAQATNYRSTVSANWSTSIGTAGTYTFKLNGSVFTNSTLQIYTTLKVVITEVA
jgi:hypothetical protein